MLNYEQVKAIEESLGAQQAVPIISALQDLDRKIDSQKTAVKTDLLVELATKADIALLKADINGLEGKINALEEKLVGKINTSEEKLEGQINALEYKLVGKINTSEEKLEGQINALEEKLEGRIDTLEKRLEGKIETEIAKVNGELKSIRLWMKLLVAIGIIGMTFFSPTTIKLLDMLK
jgi:chaperonin cofactor prefoldin